MRMCLEFLESVSEEYNTKQEIRITFSTRILISDIENKTKPKVNKIKCAGFRTVVW